MQVTGPRDFLRVMRTAERIFNTPVDLVFDSLGSIDPKHVRDVARYMKHADSPHDPTTIVTITTIGCPGICPSRMPAERDEYELNADSSAKDWPCAHIIGGSQVWQRLKQLSEPLLHVNKYRDISANGYLEMHSDDAFAILVHLMSGTNGIGAVLTSLY